MARVNDQAFVTLATNDSYAIGALVLGHSLRRVGTTKRLVVMVTTGVSQSLREQLQGAFDLLTDVNVLDSNDTANLQLLTRPDLGVTFTKLHCWRLTQFTKCVFLDADTLVLQNIDDLFEREELSAVSDVGWPDCFNSGVFVFQPSETTYVDLLKFAVTKGSFDGGDQGLLNMFFRDWSTKDISRHLSFVYNVVSQSFYSYQPAFKHFGKDAKVIHFIGSVKPWHYNYNTSTGSVDVSGDFTHCMDFLQLWWKIFSDNVQQSSLDLKLVNLSLSSPSSGSFTKEQLDDHKRQYSWENGEIDYLGIDKFENIQKQIDTQLTTAPPSTKPTIVIDKAE